MGKSLSTIDKIPGLIRCPLTGAFIQGQRQCRKAVCEITEKCKEICRGKLLLPSQKRCREHLHGIREAYRRDGDGDLHVNGSKRHYVGRLRIINKLSDLKE